MLLLLLLRRHQPQRTQTRAHTHTHARTHARTHTLDSVNGLYQGMAITAPMTLAAYIVREFSAPGSSEEQVSAAIGLLARAARCLFLNI